MRKHKVRDSVLVKLSGGRIVEATIKAIRETTEGIRLRMCLANCNFGQAQGMSQCYILSLYVVHFKGALNSGEAHGQEVAEWLGQLGLQVRTIFRQY